MLYFTFLSALCFGGICAYNAKRRDRSPSAWFLTGFFFGIFGLIVLLLLPHSKKEVVQKTTRTPPPITPEVSSIQWYYLDAATQEQHGPMSHIAIKNAHQEGRISNSTFVWNTELDNWKRLEEILFNL